MSDVGTLSTLFVYDAIDDAGVVVSGERQATDAAALATALDRQGLALVRLHPWRAWWRQQSRTGRGRIRRSDVGDLARYLSITTRAGLPVIESLREFGDDARSPAVRRLCREVVSDVSSGATLSEAFGRHPRTFAPLFLSMVRAGERSGTIDVAMERVAEQMTFQADVRSQLKSALVPPAALLVAITGLVVLLLTFLLPKVLGLLVEANVELPLPTRIVMGASDVVVAHVGTLAATLVALIVGGKLFMTTSFGVKCFARALSHVPVLGRLLRLGAQARLASSMRTLLDAGVDAVAALDLAADTTGQPQLGDQCRDVLQRAREGEPLSSAIHAIDDLHPLLVRMIRLGEGTGRLAESLAVATEHFAKEIPREVKRALSLVEPMIIAGAGCLVGFILLAVMLPMFSLYETF